MAFLVDTSVLVELERQGRSWEQVLREDAMLAEAAISAVTASELLAGVHRAASLQRRTLREGHVERFLRVLPVLPFDLSAARVHALIWADLYSNGRLIGLHDLLIAATALAHERTILTRNVREFERVPGLDVVQPTW